MGAALAAPLLIPLAGTARADEVTGTTVDQVTDAADNPSTVVDPVTAEGPVEEVTDSAQDAATNPANQIADGAEDVPTVVVTVVAGGQSVLEQISSAVKDTTNDALGPAADTVVGSVLTSQDVGPQDSGGPPVTPKEHGRPGRTHHVPSPRDGRMARSAVVLTPTQLREVAVGPSLGDVGMNRLPRPRGPGAGASSSYAMVSGGAANPILWAGFAALIASINLIVPPFYRRRSAAPALRATAFAPLLPRPG